MSAGNIAVFGGNGLTGSEVVYQALNRGCKVTAFCRDPSKLKVIIYPTNHCSTIRSNQLCKVSKCAEKRLQFPEFYTLSSGENRLDVGGEGSGVVMWSVDAEDDRPQVERREAFLSVISNSIRVPGGRMLLVCCLFSSRTRRL